MSRHPVTRMASLLAGAAFAATALFTFTVTAGASEHQAGAHTPGQTAAGAMALTAHRLNAAARQHTLTPRQRQQVERLQQDAELELVRSGSETRPDGGDPVIRAYYTLLDDILEGRRPYSDLTPPPWQAPAPEPSAVFDVDPVTGEDPSRPDTALAPLAARTTGPGAVRERLFEDIARSLSGGYGQARLNLPGTGIGFQRDTPGGAERFGAATSRSGSGHAYGAAIVLPAASKPPADGTIDGRMFRRPPSVAGLFGTTRETQSEITQIAAGGTGESGFVYGALSPSGSSGVNVSNFGSTHEARNTWRAWNVSGSYAFQGFDSLACAQLFITLYYASIIQDFDGWSQHTGGGINIEQWRDQRASNERYGFNIGVQAGGRPGDLSFGPFIPFIKASAGLANTRSSLRSEETIYCNICPPSDQTFTINTTGSQRDWDFTGSLKAGVNLPISENASFTLSAGYEHGGQIGAIWNPSSGDQVFFDGRTTELQRVNYRPRYVALGLNLRF